MYWHYVVLCNSAWHLTKFWGIRAKNGLSKFWSLNEIINAWFVLLNMSKTPSHTVTTKGVNECMYYVCHKFLEPIHLSVFPGALVKESCSIGLNKLSPILVGSVFHLVWPISECSIATTNSFYQSLSVEVILFTAICLEEHLLPEVRAFFVPPPYVGMNFPNFDFFVTF